MDLLLYFRALRRRWLLILVCLVIGAGLGYGSTLFDSKEQARTRTYYKATNTLVLDSSQGSSGALSPSFTNLDQMAILITTGDVPDRVADTLGTSQIGRELAEHIVTTTNPLTSTLDITAADPDAEQAVLLADTFADELIASLNDRDEQRYTTSRDNLQAETDSLKAEADGYLAQLNTVPPPPDAETIRRQYDATQNAYYQSYNELQQLTRGGPATTSLTVLDSAQSQPIDAGEYNARLDLGALGNNNLRAGTSDTAESPIAASTSQPLSSPAARTVAGAFLGLLIGIGLALLGDRLDRRIRTREDAERAFGLPVVAEVPKLAHAKHADDTLVSHTEPLSRGAEAFRALRTSLTFQQSAADGGSARNRNGAAPAALFEPDAGEPMVVMVTSASPREGKTTTSANLAVAFAEADASVLVVNCDFRRPTIHRLFGVSDEPRRVQDTMVAGVKIVTNVLPDANANPSQVVAAQRQVIAAARGRFDVIILDTAPLLAANDAVDVVGSTDVVVLVARPEMTTSDNARRVIDLLERVHAQLGGVVLMATTDEANSDYYYDYQADKNAKPPSSNGKVGQPTVENRNGAGTIFAASAGQPGPVAPVDEAAQP